MESLETEDTLQRLREGLPPEPTPDAALLKSKNGALLHCRACGALWVRFPNSSEIQRYEESDETDG